MNDFNSDHSAELAALARAARRLYVFHFRQHAERRTGVASYFGAHAIPQWDGGLDRAGRNHKPIWPKIARAVLAQRAGLADFIAAQFLLAPPGDAPWPNQLLSQAAPGAVLRYARDVAQTAAVWLTAQHAQFALAVSRCASEQNLAPGAAARASLQDRTVPISPLYRYCVATMTHEKSIADAFKEPALAQYLSCPAGYRASWSDLVPSLLVIEAECAMEKLLAGRNR